MLQLSFYNHKFEIEEKTITITESDFDEAVTKVFGNIPYIDYRIKEVKKEVGF